MRPVVISLCDLTGNITKSWSEGGWDVVLVDPQHGSDSSIVTSNGAVVTRLAKTILEAMPALSEIIRTRDVEMVFGFPPCTDMAVSGSRWFASKRENDPQFWSKAAIVAEQCRMVGELSGAPYFVENPVSVLSSIFGKPDHIFNPHDYTGFEPADNYTKKTCLWTGNGFVMPPPFRDPSLGAPDNRIHFASPGPERANFRSVTPLGFATAVFYANTIMGLGLRETA